MHLNGAVLLLISSSIAFINADCPNIVTKDQWGGRIATVIDYILIPVKYVIVSHTVSGECENIASCSDIIQNIQDYQMDTLEYTDIGFNFLIGNDGNVYEGAGWHMEGAHTYSWNKKSIGIAFIGDFSTKLPTEVAIDAAKKLMRCGVDKGELDPNFKLYGHRQVASTKGPGTRLYQNMANWPNFSRLVDRL